MIISVGSNERCIENRISLPSFINSVSAKTTKQISRVVIGGIVNNVAVRSQASVPRRCSAGPAYLPQGSDHQRENRSDGRLVVGVLQRQRRMVPTRVRQVNAPSTGHGFSPAAECAAGHAKCQLCSLGQATAIQHATCRFSDSSAGDLLSGGESLRAAATESVRSATTRARHELPERFSAAASAAASCGSRRSFCGIAKHEQNAGSNHAAAAATIVTTLGQSKHDRKHESRNESKHESRNDNSKDGFEFKHNECKHHGIADDCPNSFANQRRSRATAIAIQIAVEHVHT